MWPPHGPADSVGLTPSIMDLTAWSSLTATRRAAQRYLHPRRRPFLMSAATVALVYHCRAQLF
jgi:hypothetical protein